LAEEARTRTIFEERASGKWPVHEDLPPLGSTALLAPRAGLFLTGYCHVEGSGIPLNQLGEEGMNQPTSQIQSLPDSILSDILRRVSEDTGDVQHPLVCRRWNQLTATAQNYVRMKRHDLEWI